MRASERVGRKRVERPQYAWLAVDLEILTAIGAIPVGIMFLLDPTGGHPIAPWLTGALGVGLIIWILVEILVPPLTMILTWTFLATGFALGVIALFWLRRTGQLRL